MRGCFVASWLALGLLAPAENKIEPKSGNMRASGWLTDYEAAKRLARQNGKPLLVVFR